MPKVALARMLLERAEGRWTKLKQISDDELAAYLENPLFFSRQFLEEAAAASPDSCIYGYLIDQVAHERGSQEQAEQYLQLGEQLDLSDYQPEAEFARYLHKAGKNWRAAVSRPHSHVYHLGVSSQG